MVDKLIEVVSVANHHPLEIQVTKDEVWMSTDYAETLYLTPDEAERVALALLRAAARVRVLRGEGA